MRAGQGGVVMATRECGLWCACGSRSFSFSRQNALQRKIDGHVLRFGSSVGARHVGPGGRAGRNTCDFHGKLGTVRGATGTGLGRLGQVARHLSFSWSQFWREGWVAPLPGMGAALYQGRHIQGLLLRIRSWRSGWVRAGSCSGRGCLNAQAVRFSEPNRHSVSLRDLVRTDIIYIRSHTGLRIWRAIRVRIRFGGVPL